MEAHERPDCFRCRRFRVTHDAERPYGCDAFGFRSRLLPRDEVRLSSGRECGAFEEKGARERPRMPGPT